MTQAIETYRETPRKVTSCCQTSVDGTFPKPFYLSYPLNKQNDASSQGSSHFPAVQNKFLSLFFHLHTENDVLGLEVFHHVLESLQLCLQLVLLARETVQLLPQPADVGFKKGVEVAATRPGAALLLQEFPLGLQDSVLLLQEPHLNGRRVGRKRVRLFPKASHNFSFFTFLPILISSEQQDPRGQVGPQLWDERPKVGHLPLRSQPPNGRNAVNFTASAPSP